MRGKGIRDQGREFLLGLTTHVQDEILGTEQDAVLLVKVLELLLGLEFVAPDFSLDRIRAQGNQSLTDVGGETMGEKFEEAISAKKVTTLVSFFFFFKI